MNYRIIFQPVALKMLEAISDRRIQGSIAKRIDDLTKDPDKQGKPLLGELSGYRALRAVGQRYRIVYRVEKNRVVVLIVALGIRKDGSRADVYELAQKLLRLGLLNPPH